MRKIILLLILLSMAAAGCSSGTPAKKLNIELNDFTITPNQITVQAGSEVSINVTNNGTIEHDLNIMMLGTDIGDTFGDEDRENVIWEVSLQPGETTSGTFTVPDQPGTYQMVCSFPGHMQAGMTGTLEVIK